MKKEGGGRNIKDGGRGGELRRGLGRLSGWLVFFLFFFFIFLLLFLFLFYYLNNKLRFIQYSFQQMQLSRRNDGFQWILVKCISVPLFHSQPGGSKLISRKRKEKGGKGERRNQGLEFLRVD